MALPQLAAVKTFPVSRLIAPLAVGVVAAFAAGAFFVVPQTDVAFVKRFGKVLDPQTGPLQPLLSFAVRSIEDEAK